MTIPGYPRPQLRRADWHSLNGRWDFAFDPQRQWPHPDAVSWDRSIEVPFAPETARSGIGDTGFHPVCWYRRVWDVPAYREAERVILHFGAVDYLATLWVNGAEIGTHMGGYTPFSFDVTPYVRPNQPARIALRAEDDPLDLQKPRGKQDWQLEPHAIWYPRTSGIWQTVWAECVPATRISRLRLTPSLDRWEIDLYVEIAGLRDDDWRLLVTLRAGSRRLAEDAYTVVAGELHRRIALSDPGIDDSRNELLWSPTSPTLIGVDVRLVDGENQPVDTVWSYTALRAIAVQGDRVVLNGRVCPLRLVLDQGYWPESGLTPPDDNAIRRDVELAKAMGFNGVRKHQKIEDPRYLYWADHLGLLVWEEMPSAYRFTTQSIEQLTRQWQDVVERDYSHPCIIAWVPLNESWGVPNLPNSPAERHYVQALYHLTKTLDPTRPVIGNDGWESVATDIIGIHDYDDDVERMAQRYYTQDVRPRLFMRERPGGRALILAPHQQTDHPVVLSEFGGLALQESGGWGYSTCTTPKELAEKYRALLEAVHSLQMLAGFCYTQFADTYQERNGLLYADRTPKFDLADIARATGGRRLPWEQTPGAEDRPHD